MSITSEIQRLQTAKADIKTQLEGKGVTVSTAATLDDYPDLVASIPTTVYSGDVQSIINAFANGSISGEISITSGGTAHNANRLRPFLFYGCDEITAVNYYNDGLQGYTMTIPESCFDGCKKLTAFNITGKNPLAKPISLIEKNAFHDCRSMKSVPQSLMEDVEGIGEMAFYNCPLTSITFGDKLTSIGVRAFAYDDNVPSAFTGQNIMIPSGVTVIQGDYSNAVFHNTYATGFTFLGNVKQLGSNYSTSNYRAFSRNRQCEEYNFTNNWMVPSRVPSNEFDNSKDGYRIVVPQVLYDKWITTQNWVNFASHIVSGQNVYDMDTYTYTYDGTITFPNPESTDGCQWSMISSAQSEGQGTITVYGKNRVRLFAIYNGLYGVTMPTGATRIDDYMFYSSQNLSAVTIPDSVETIGYRAFQECYALSNFTLPNSLVSIGNNAFTGCPFINSGVTFPDSLEYIGKGFGSNTNNINFGTDDSSVTTFNIPDSVKYIGDGFLVHYNEIGTTYINIGSGITHIGKDFYRAYGYSNNHKMNLTIRATVPPTLDGNLGSTQITIYVPAESVDAYKAAQGWSSYAHRINPIE